MLRTWLAWFGGKKVQMSNRHGNWNKMMIFLGEKG